MKLQQFDEVQIAGEHPTNPITGEVILQFLQYFIVTKDVEGEMISHTALHPYIDHDVPARSIVRLNGVPINAALP